MIPITLYVFISSVIFKLGDGKNSFFCKNVLRTSSSSSSVHYRIGYVHASKFVFNEHAMLFDPISFLCAKIFVMIKFRNISNRRKITTWSKIEAEEVMNKLNNN